MSLEQLQQLKSEADSLGWKARAHESAKDDLAKVRTGPYSLTDAIAKVFVRWHGGGDAIAKAELYAVINEMAPDLYRIAEMRLAAKARSYKVEGAQKQAIITASILPLPEMEKEQVL